MKPRSRRPARRPRRRIMNRKSKFSGSSGIEKIYKYKASITPSYLSNATITEAGLVRQQPCPESSYVPMFPPLWSPGSGVPADSVFPSYYDFGASAEFTLTDLVNSTALIGLYDSWRLNAVNLKITYMCTGAAVNGAGLMPTLYYYVDRDDVIVPTAKKQVTGKQGHKMFQFGDGSKQVCNIRIKPKLAPLVYSTISTNNQIGYTQSVGNPWNDCAPAGATNSYHGIKLWFSDVLLPAGTATNTAFKVELQYELEFKGALNLF